MDLILLLAFTYLVTLVIGIGLEKIEVPWIFASLIFGLILAWKNPFSAVTSTETFHFLSKLGMYFLLFTIGFKINLKELLKRGKHILKSGLFIVFLEAVTASTFLHFVFGTPWLIAFLVGTSFATVGEVVLLPILDEHNLIKTDLGQSILGIGVVDNIIEVLTIVIASLLIGAAGGFRSFDLAIDLLSLLALFAGTFLFTKLRDKARNLHLPDIEAVFLFLMFIMFVFIAVGDYTEAGAIGAILAGIALKNFIPWERQEFIERQAKTIAYGLFAPLFFVSAGIETNMSYLFSAPFIMVAVVALTYITNVSGGVITNYKRLGAKKSLILGNSLSIKFTHSLIILKLLFENDLINTDLYSVLVASKVVIMLITPFLLSYLITHLGVSPTEKEKEE